MTLRARVGMVFQKPNPFPKSIFDNVAYGPRIHGLASDRNFPALPFVLDTVPKWYIDDDNHDYGLIPLSRLFTAQLTAGGVVPLNAEAWEYDREDGDQ